MTMQISSRYLTSVLSVLLLHGAALGQAPAPAEDSAFVKALRTGDPQLVLPFLGNAEQANAMAPLLQNPRGGSPTGNRPALVVASRAGHASLVRLLIKNGADVQSQGENALAEAVSFGRVAVVKELLEGGVKLSGSAGDLRMAAAVAGGFVDIAELLLKNGGSLARLPAAALERVACEGPNEMRIWLRQHNVEIPAQDVNERLMVAIWAHDLLGVQRITRDSSTGFFMGTKWAGMEVRPTDLYDVRRLINWGNLNWHGGARSAGAAAAASGDKDILAAIVEAGTPKSPNYIDCGDALLRRPLWFAAERGDVAMTEWILAHGAVVDAPTFSGQTALGVATALGHNAVADVLLKHGAKPVEVVPARASDNIAGGAEIFPKGFKRPSVALAPLAIDDGWYASLAAAKDLGAALEAGALGLPEVHWVERAEVERLGGEWATESLGGNDPTSALQKGRLARADWMVTTRLLPDEGHGRKVIFEVLDTLTAESLAMRRVTLSGRLGLPLKFELASVPDLMKGMRSALAAAAQAMQAAQGRQRLACLFFANKAPTDRFVTLAGEAMETMAAVAESPAEKLPHVVRFQRSRSVLGEAELAAAGWLDQGEQGLQKVADAFAWGSVSEVGNSDAPRDEVQIKLTWEVWSGGAETVKHEAVSRAGDALATMRSLSKKVLSNLPSKGGLTNLKDRESMGQKLAEQAKALSIGGNNSASAEARQRWRERVALLEAAHFLNPERATLEAAMMLERRHPMLSAGLGTSERSVVDFYNDLQRYAAWNRFVKSNGYGPLRSLFSDEPMLRGARWPIVFGYDPAGVPAMETRHAELARGLITQLSQMDPCVPSDLPPRVREQWMATLGAEHASLLAEAAKTGDGKLDLMLLGRVGSLAFIPDPALRYRTAALILRGIVHPLRVPEVDINQLCSEMLAMGENAGMGEEALAALRDWRKTIEKAGPDPIAQQAAQQRENNVEWKIAEARQAERLTAELAKIQGKPGWLSIPHEVRELTGYYRAGTVWAISPYHGKLYLAVRGSRTDRSYNDTVWEHDMTKNTFTLVPGLDFKLPQDRIGLRAHDTGLWMWTSLNGIWHRDWTTGIVTHHESKTGLPVDQVLCAADLGGTMYFGGGKYQDGAMFSWDGATRSWRVFRRPRENNWKMGTVDHLHAMGDELFVQEESPNWAALNPQTNTWRDLTGYLRTNKVGPMAPLPRDQSLLVTNRTLWSWGPQHFSRVDLAKMTHKAVAPLAEAPAVTGYPRALAETEEWIWAVMRDEKIGAGPGLNINRLFAIKKSDGTVQAAILLPMVCEIFCAVAVDKTLWLGVERGQTATDFSGPPCLVRVGR